LNFINIIALLLACSTSFAQNKMNDHGLKCGHWNKDGVDCFYKIIPFTYYDTVSFDHDRRLEIRQFNGDDTTDETIIIYGYFGDSISVRDGLFKACDSTGKLSQIIDYHLGLVGNMILFSDGDTTQYNHNFMDSIKGNYYDHYLNNRAFSREFYRNHEFAFSYYPYDDLVISDALLVSEIDLLKTTFDTLSVLLQAKKDLTVNSVSCANNIRVLDKEYHPIKYPFTITSKDRIDLKIINHQYGDIIHDHDTLIIKTGPDNKQYSLFLNTAASHISKSNVQILKKITLSRQKDKELLINNCGPYGHMRFASKKGHSDTYQFEGNKVWLIPLSDFYENEYKLDVRMCYDDGEGIGGVIDLILSD